jgi:RimJ/RimL family protein N-acetyltransferase
MRLSRANPLLLPYMLPMTTERLLLRAPTEADLDAVFAIYADSRTQQFNPFGAMTSREAAGHLLWRWQLHWMRHGFGIWAICRREAPEQVIGFGGVQWHEAGRALRLHMHLHGDALGQGFGTEAARAVLRSVVALPVQPLVRAVVSPSHAAALQWLGNLGFTVEGTQQALPWAAPQTVLALPPRRTATATFVQIGHAAPAERRAA